MKKYIELQGEDILMEGDEWLTSREENRWEPVPENLLGKNSWAIFTNLRRTIKNEGHVQFLMHVSILVPVVVNCDDKTQEETENEAGRLAVEKILADPTQYVHLENIDWEGSKVDDVQPEWRMLEAGETIEGGDQVKLPFETWEEVQNSIGMKIKPHNAGMVRRRIN